MINIEPAKSQHIEDLLSLNDLVQKQHADSLPEIFKYPVDSLALKEEYLSNIFSDDHYIYVALINEKVIGYLWAEHIRRNETPLTYSGSKLYIHHISVSEAHRRNRVGASLMNRAEKLAESLKVDYIALDVWSFNHEAEEFFKENKFSGYNRKMWKSKKLK